MREIYKYLYSVLLSVGSFIFSVTPFSAAVAENKPAAAITRPFEGQPIFLEHASQYLTGEETPQLIAGHRSHSSHSSHSSHYSSSGGHASHSSHSSHYSSSTSPTHYSSTTTTPSHYSASTTPATVLTQNYIDGTISFMGSGSIYLGASEFTVRSNAIYTPSSWKPAVGDSVRIYYNGTNPYKAYKIVKR